MTITTVSSRELNQDVARAKKAVKSGLVFINDRVLLSIEDYGRLTGQGRSLVEAFLTLGLADIDFGSTTRAYLGCCARSFLMLLLGTNALSPGSSSQLLAGARNHRDRHLIEVPV